MRPEELEPLQTRDAATESDLAGLIDREFAVVGERRAASTARARSPAPPPCGSARAGRAGVATVAVLPFVPVVPDSALERLGHELVVTLAANLDGAGGLRVVEPITVQDRSAHAGRSSWKVRPGWRGGSALPG